MKTKPKNGRFSRTKATAAAGTIVAALCAVAGVFGYELPIPEETLRETLDGVILLAVWFLRDTI